MKENAVGSFSPYMSVSVCICNKRSYLRIRYLEKVYGIMSNPNHFLFFFFAQTYSSMQELGEAAEEQKLEIFGKLSSGLLSIAKRHEGYKTLWNVCCGLNNTELLKNVMVNINLCFACSCLS